MSSFPFKRLPVGVLAGRGAMDFANFPINSLVDEVSGDSEFDSAVAAADAAVAGPDAPDVAALVDGAGDDDDDRESAVGSDSDDGEEHGGEDDREHGGDGECVEDGGNGEEEESMRWWSPEGYGMVEEEEDEKRITDKVEDARERDRRFWETCLESGYP